MGSIQNSVNQMIGTAGTVAAIAEHASEQKKQIEETKKGTEVANEAKEIAAASAKMDALSKSLAYEEKGQALQTEKNQTIDALTANAEEAHMLNKQIIDKRNSKGQFMSKKALQEAADRVVELKDQRLRLEEQLGYVGNKIDLHKELGNAMADVFNKTLKGGNK